MGITGARDAVSSSAAGVVARIREHTGLPVAVGLGVSTGAQAGEVAGFADGVIVGSAFVRRLAEAAPRPTRSPPSAPSPPTWPRASAAGNRRPAPRARCARRL